MLLFVPSGVERSPLPFRAFVTGTFLLGWLGGFAAVFKLWQLAQAPRWMMFSGAGYVTFMLVPALAGVIVTRLAGRLVARGWGGAPLRFVAVGLCGVLAGLLAI
jgi:hypothetical protein